MEVLLLIFGGFIVWKVITTKARLHRSKKAQAQREVELGVAGKSPPSWANNEKKIDEMLAMLEVHITSKDIPKLFLEGMLSTEENFYPMLLKARLMEQKGSSFEEQVLGMSDMVSEKWQSLTQEQKTRFLEANK